MPGGWGGGMVPKDIIQDKVCISARVFSPPSFPIEPEKRSGSTLAMVDPDSIEHEK
jgi:hypothetical protein